MIPLKSPKIGSWKKTSLSLDLRMSKKVLHIGETKVSNFKFMHTLSESKSIFAIEQKVIVSCFVKNVACVFIGTPCILYIYMTHKQIRTSQNKPETKPCYTDKTNPVKVMKVLGVSENLWTILQRNLVVMNTSVQQILLLLHS